MFLCCCFFRFFEELLVVALAGGFAQLFIPDCEVNPAVLNRWFCLNVAFSHGSCRQIFFRTLCMLLFWSHHIGFLLFVAHLFFSRCFLSNQTGPQNGKSSLIKTWLIVMPNSLAFVLHVAIHRCAILGLICRFGGCTFLAGTLPNKTIDSS